MLSARTKDIFFNQKKKERKKYFGFLGTLSDNSGKHCLPKPDPTKYSQVTQFNRRNEPNRVRVTRSDRPLLPESI